MKGKKTHFILSCCVLLTACAVGDNKPPGDLLTLTDSQLKIRNYQSRTFDTNDQIKTIRAVIASLLDLGFIVERVNGPMGLVTAGKFNGSSLSSFVELTVIVLPKNNEQVEVRINALFNAKPIDDPKTYQNFFNAVQRSLFLSG